MKRIIAEEKKTQSTNQFLETIRKYETVTDLNRSMLVELIDSIYVYQAEGTGKERRQKVEINYRFLAGSQTLRKAFTRILLIWSLSLKMYSAMRGHDLLGMDLVCHGLCAQKGSVGQKKNL